MRGKKDMLEKKLQLVFWGLVALLFFKFSMPAYAGEYGGNEPLILAQTIGNHTMSGATVLSSGTEVADKITSESIENWYKLTLPADGYIRILLDHEVFDMAGMWEICVWDSTGSKEIERHSAFIIYDGGIVYGYENIGLAKGTYYLTINSSKLIGIDYKLSYEYVKSDSWVKEPNWSFESSNELVPDKYIFAGGRGGYNNMYDYYYFDIEEKGKIKLDILSGDPGYDMGAEIVIYDSEKNKILYSFISSGQTFDYLSLNQGRYYIRLYDRYQVRTYYGLKLTYIPESQERLLPDDADNPGNTNAENDKSDTSSDNTNPYAAYDLDDKYVPNGYVDNSGSPMIMEGKNLSWNEVGGKSYWYENGIKQGTYYDTYGVMGDGTIRGREIFDPESDGWYWLDSVYDGAKAVGKEVWVPYIYQDEDGISDTERHNRANSCDSGMADCVYNAMLNKTGKWVRYDENGKMLKGWVTIEGALAEKYPAQAGNTYYYDSITGLMAKGWVTIGGVSYYFDETTGVLQ